MAAIRVFRVLLSLTILLVAFSNDTFGQEWDGDGSGTEDTSSPTNGLLVLFQLTLLLVICFLIHSKDIFRHFLHPLTGQRNENLASSTTKHTFEDLAADLRNPVEAVQLNAIHQLARQGSNARPWAPQVVKLLDSQSHSVQLAVVQALHPIGLEASEAVPLLLKALNRRHLENSAVASLALYGETAVPLLKQAMAELTGLTNKALQDSALNRIQVFLEEILQCRSCGGTGKGHEYATCPNCMGNPESLADDYGDPVSCDRCNNTGSIPVISIEVGTCGPCHGTGQKIED